MGDAILRPFKHYFSHIRKKGGDNVKLCAMEESVGKPSETDSIKSKISSVNPIHGWEDFLLQRVSNQGLLE